MCTLNYTSKPWINQQQANSPEPLDKDNELWGLENVIITPHIAGRLEGNRERVSVILLENLRRYCCGEPLLNVVDKKLGY